ncbi:MAG: helix-turn-helix domain-containing protein, partial [Sneathiella sp.]
MARQAAYDRTEVLGKALELFWAKGYHGTSLRDLETALDMRPGSIYAAFVSKEKLFDEALRLYAVTSRGILKDTLARAATPLAGLADHIRNLGRVKPGTASSRACMLVKTLLETPDEDPVLRRTAERLIGDAEATFAAVFRAAQETGQIPTDTDPELLASRVQSEIFGLRTYAQRTDVVDRVAALADDIARDIERLASV